MVRVAVYNSTRFKISASPVDKAEWIRLKQSTVKHISTIYIGLSH